MRRRGGGHGGPTGGAIRQPIKTGRITGRIMGGDAHARQNGARIGQYQAGVQALRCCRRAAGADDLAAAVGRDEDEGFRQRAKCFGR
jgi:hypothetical protein